jgi:hypothetical protein
MTLRDGLASRAVPLAPAWCPRSVSCGRSPKERMPWRKARARPRPASRSYVVRPSAPRPPGAYGYSEPRHPARSWSPAASCSTRPTRPPVHAPAVMSLLTAVPEHHRVRMVFQRCRRRASRCPSTASRPGYTPPRWSRTWPHRRARLPGGSNTSTITSRAGALVGHSSARPSSAPPSHHRRCAGWLAQGPRGWRPLSLVHYMDHPRALHAAHPPFPPRQPVAIDPNRGALQRIPGVTDGPRSWTATTARSPQPTRAWRFIEAWERETASGRSAVVLTADHGETLMEPGASKWCTPRGSTLVKEQARVPLVHGGDGIPQGRERAGVPSGRVPTLLAMACGASAPGLDAGPCSVPADAERRAADRGHGPHARESVRRCPKGTQNGCCTRRTASSSRRPGGCQPRARTR